MHVCVCGGRGEACAQQWHTDGTHALSHVPGKAAETENSMRLTTTGDRNLQFQAAVSIIFFGGGGCYLQWTLFLSLRVFLCNLLKNSSNIWRKLPDFQAERKAHMSLASACPNVGV